MQGGCVFWLCFTQKCLYSRTKMAVFTQKRLCQPGYNAILILISIFIASSCRIFYCPAVSVNLTAAFAAPSVSFLAGRKNLSPPLDAIKFYISINYFLVNLPSICALFDTIRQQQNQSMLGTRTREFQSSSSRFMRLLFLT